MSADLDLLRLNLVPGITPRAAAVLLGALGRPEAVFRASRSDLASLPDVSKALAARLAAPPSPGEARSEIRRAERRGILILHPGGEGYPERLLEMPDPPTCLYVRGDPAGFPDAVAVVGARKASTYGRVNGERFGAGLARAGPLVVSGLARGVDAAAHRGAIDAGGRTAAVMGCGLARVYPAEHRRLAEEVAANGFLCSELPLQAPPLAWHFPMRNRIIAGLSSAVVVVEGALRSGSLITARLAADLGRYVFAVPGGVDNGLSRGPHSLIREGAILAEGPEDVLHDLGYRPITEEREVELPEDPLQRRILGALSETEPRGLDSILREQRESAPAVLAALTSLELADRVRLVEGRRYLRR